MIPGVFRLHLSKNVCGMNLIFLHFRVKQTNLSNKLALRIPSFSFHCSVLFPHVFACLSCVFFLLLLLVVFAVPLLVATLLRLCFHFIVFRDVFELSFDGLFEFVKQLYACKCTSNYPEKTYCANSHCTKKANTYASSHKIQPFDMACVCVYKCMCVCTRSFVRSYMMMV